MIVRPTRFLVSMAGVLLALVIGATPVAAYNHLGTTGTTGTHSLTDTRSSPGADCHYRFEDSGSAWELRRITVDPPNVQASAFQDGDQEVGWRFTVDRRYSDAFHEQPGPWVRRYASPIQKAVTDADHDASFSPMGVRVFVPDNASSDVSYHYRVIVKVFWYRDNGSISGTARMRVEWFNSFVENDTRKQRLSCTSLYLS